MDIKFKKLLLDEYNDNPKGVVMWLTKKPENEPLLTALREEFPQLTCVGEMLYWLANELIDFPKCPVCGKSITTYASRHYPRHCSCRCTQLDKEVRNKNRSTCLERYGVDNASRSAEIKAKAKQTCLERFGTDNIFKNKEYIKKCTFKKLGVSNAAKLSSVIQKRKNTLKKKYGVDCSFKLVKNFNKSKGELELYSYIKTLFPTSISGDREKIEPLELDIFIPELNVAIEYDGDYWHNLPEMKRRDHLKTKICKLKNIKLIRIKESDWKNNSDQIKLDLLKEIYCD